MSGHSGSPQNDPPDSEGVQPMDSEVQHSRKTLQYIEISPNSNNRALFRHNNPKKSDICVVQKYTVNSHE